MFNDILTNKKMALLMILVQIILLFALIIYQNIIVALLAIISFLFAATIWRFGFMIKPIISRNIHYIEAFGTYEIPSSEDVIVKKLVISIILQVISLLDLLILLVKKQQIKSLL